MCDMTSGGGEGTPILTISIMAGGKPVMPPGHDIKGDHDMMGGDMDMHDDMDMAEDKAVSAPRPMAAIKGLKPKREVSKPRSL